MQRVVSFFLFCVFFAIGLSGLGLSVLCDDLVSFYSGREVLRAVEASSEKLRSLNEDYDILLEQLRDDPNLLERVARVTLGSGLEDSNAVYPKARPEELVAAREALARDSEVSADVLPQWLERIREPRRRLVLFLSGSVLILIAFIFFGTVKTEITRKSEG